MTNCEVPGCKRRAIANDGGHWLCYVHHMQWATAIPFAKMYEPKNPDEGGYS